ncbi:MAG: hypothetical protein K0A89_12525 [ANME-2 cluster archaeon]|nr:hypothetical protein [ANME-2 cluster archaeon]
MKSGIRDIIFILLSIVLAIIIAPFIMKLASHVVEIVIIIALAYVFFIMLKQLIK